MDLSVREEVRDVIFAHEVLRRLGFTPDQIRPAVYNEAALGYRVVGVVLNADGKRWIWNIAAWESSDEEFNRELQAAIAAWNSAPPSFDLWGFMTSRILSEGSQAAFSIVAKGIAIPSAGRPLR